MSIDKRIYVVTSIAAAVIAGVITFAAPRGSMEEIASRNAGTGIVQRTEAGSTLALAPAGEGGVSARIPVPAERVGIVR